MNYITSNSLTQIFHKFQSSTLDLWNKSKHFRIISITTATISGTLFMRYIYIKMYRKYHNLPDGTMGLPFLGNINSLFNLANNNHIFNKYECICSCMFGPTHGVMICNPYLARKIYSDSKLVYNTKIIDSDAVFLFTNGKMWSVRRKMIYANLLSTMKSNFVECCMKKFMINKVFPVFDEQIKNNEIIQMKPLFRPIGFNIVLQACFGKELTSLNDPIWFNWNDYQKQQTGVRMTLIFIILFVFGDSSNISEFLQKLIIGRRIKDENKQLTKMFDELCSNTERNAMHNFKDNNVKLFSEYMDDYLNHKEIKLNKSHFYGDMMGMFFASTDTTYSALSFALLLAAKYPNIQNKLYEQLNNAFQGDINNVQLGHGGILKIPKLRAFIHESLRLYAPAQGAGFRVIHRKGYTIDTGKFETNGKVYNIPIGTQLLINIPAISINPKFWIKNYENNKDKYKNINMKEIHFEFWLDNNGAFRKVQNAASFMNFGVGKRDCIGQALVMKELLIVLSIIFLKYKILPPTNDKHFRINASFGGTSFEPTPDCRAIRLLHR